MSSVLENNILQNFKLDSKTRVKFLGLIGKFIELLFQETSDLKSLNFSISFFLLDFSVQKCEISLISIKVCTTHIWLVKKDISSLIHSRDTCKPANSYHSVHNFAKKMTYLYEVVVTLRMVCTLVMMTMPTTVTILLLKTMRIPLFYSYTL